MTFRLHFAERAKPEIQDAYNWYEDQQSGLGERFLLKLDETFDRIISNPFLFPQKLESFRECYMDVFPFLVIYIIKEKNIYIHAVFHTSRNPKKKK
jgi:hypothetical protein